MHTDPQTALFTHNPACGTSRGALALLQERGITVTVRHYLEPDQKLSEAELRQIAAMMARPGQPPVSPLGFLRGSEADAFGITLDTTDEELFALMAAHPILVNRPLVVWQGRAVLARPKEVLLHLLDPDAVLEG
jgi:arsenate reductase